MSKVANLFLEMMRFIFLLLLCTNLSDLLAQSKLKDGWNLNINYHNGAIIPEFDLLDNIEEDNTNTFEISLSKRSIGKKVGQQLYNYPENGVSIYYSSLGHQEVLGSILGVDYFFKAYFIEKNRFSFYGQSGIGINYLSKIQDPIDNPLNTAMSSHINFHFNFRFGMKISVLEKLSINLGPSFDHFSNANLKYPNRGINAVAVVGGVTYHFGKEIEKPEKKVGVFERKTAVELMTNFGFKHVKNPIDTYRSTPSILLELNNTTFRFLSLGIGTELRYDASVKPYLESEGIAYNSIFSYQAGIYISQAFVYEKFNFVLQEGWFFLLAEELDEKNFYNRILFKYHIRPKLSLHLSLTAHLQELKYVGVGIGYKFGRH